MYLSISCVSSWSFPAALSVLVFQVPMVMLSLPRIIDDALVAYLTHPSWCTEEGTVLVDTGSDRSGMVWLCVVIAWWVLGKVQPDGAIPLHVEQVAFKFIVKPFRPSGHGLRTMKISAQRCRVDTSYFTHNWETRGGRERLPSRIGPKELPTAHFLFQLYIHFEGTHAYKIDIKTLSKDSFDIYCFQKYTSFTFTACAKGVVNWPK